MFKCIITSLFLFLSFSSNAKAQTSVEVSANVLLNALNHAETHVMFNIKDGELYILDQDRNAIYPANYTAPDNEVYYVYEINQVKNYINQQNTRTIKLTKDGNGAVGFVDDGVTIMMAFPCPPACPIN